MSPRPEVARGSGGVRGVGGGAGDVGQIGDGPEDDPSLLRWSGYDPSQEPLREALCTLGNGVFATRGAAAECPAGGAHHPGTYLAGVYDRATSRVVGQRVENEDLVNAPDWLPLRVRAEDGPWWTLDDVEVLAHEQVLDVRRGLLLRTTRWRDAAGRTTRLLWRRLVHLGSPHLAAQELVVQPEDWSGRVVVRSALDGGVRNDGVARYRGLEDRHLETLERLLVSLDDDGGAGGEEAVLLRSRTLSSHVEVALVARTRVDGRGAGGRCVLEGSDAVAWETCVDVAAGQRVVVEKVVSLRTSRDVATSSPAVSALDDVRAAGGFEELLGSHARAWAELWERSEIRVLGAPDLQRVVDLHLFHVLQVASPHVVDVDAGVPARGLHGEAYRGHVFWDELFVLPLLHHRSPDVAQALLRYRHRRLPAARRAARAAGCRGAAFPWQSGSDGREESQQLHLNPLSGRWVPDGSWRQRHVGLAVALNAWRCVQATGDTGFLVSCAAELVLEVSRFFADLAVHDPVRDRYEITGVVGPDEFHADDPGWSGTGLRNNAYTNVLTAWLLEQVPAVLGALPPREAHLLRTRLRLTDAELERWDRISRRLVVPFLPDGVIAQFEGYEQLAELDWDAYRSRYGDISRLDRILEAEGRSVEDYRASKQADVLMLPFLFSAEELQHLLARLGHPFSTEQLRRTTDHYLARTTHGSTLSRLVHSWVLARVDRRASMELLAQALASDLEDVQGTTGEGVHLGAMAGTLDMLVRCYSGLETAGGLLRFKPSLPVGVEGLMFPLLHRGRWLTVHLHGDDLEVTCEATSHRPLAVQVRSDRRELASAEHLHFAHRDRAQRRAAAESRLAAARRGR